MKDIKGIFEIISPYLPRQAKVLELGTYYNTMAIEEQDLNGNGYKEIILIYEYEQDNYLLILERGKRSWAIAYNRQLPFEEVAYLKVESIVDAKTKQIMIGGKKVESEDTYQLEIFKYTGSGLESILELPIYFHKIDTQIVENKVQIIVWERIKLEAYNINVYRYEQGIVLGGWNESLYFKSVVGYYRYLVDIYPGEEIYQQCLEDALARVNGKVFSEELMEEHQQIRNQAKEVENIQGNEENNVESEEETPQEQMISMKETILIEDIQNGNESIEEEDEVYQAIVKQVDETKEANILNQEIADQDIDPKKQEVDGVRQSYNIDKMLERGYPLQQTKMSQMQKQKNVLQMQEGSEELQIVTIYEKDGKTSDLYIMGQRVPNSAYIKNLQIIWSHEYGKQIIYYNNVEKVSYSLFLGAFRYKEEDDIVLMIRGVGKEQCSYKVFIKEEMIYKEIFGNMKRDRGARFKLYYLWDETSECFKIVNVNHNNVVQVMDIVEDELVVSKSVNIY